MHPNFEKAFEASKKKEYLNARALYEDLLLDIRTYSDYFLIKEILFLLDIEISTNSEIKQSELPELIETLKCEKITGNRINQILNKNDSGNYDYVILINKKSLLHPSSYIAINEQEGYLSFYYFKDKYKIMANHISLRNIDLMEYDSKIYFYQFGCEFTLVSNQKANDELKKYFGLFRILFTEYNLSHPFELIDSQKVHEWFELLDSYVHIDQTRIETQDFQEFTFDEKNQREIIHYLKMIDPIMWISDNNLERVKIEDLQFDLIGKRWCNHRIFKEFKAILKTLPDFEFGRSGFFDKNSLYAPYIQNYYICRNITRLENDQEFK